MLVLNSSPDMLDGASGDSNKAKLTRQYSHCNLAPFHAAGPATGAAARAAGSGDVFENLVQSATP